MYAVLECVPTYLTYLFLVILGNMAEELTSLPEKDILLTELFLQELLQHKNQKWLGKHKLSESELSFFVLHFEKKFFCVSQSLLMMLLL